MKTAILLCCLLGLGLFGCAPLQSLYHGGEDEIIMDEHQEHYPLKDGLDIQITFENRKTYDATQLGLFLLGKTEGLETTISVEDPDFFPKYYAIINTEIKDGMLYISEDEATLFAQAAYQKYRDIVKTAVDMKEWKRPYTLSEVIVKK